MIRTYFTMLFAEMEQEHPEIDLPPDEDLDTLTPAELSAHNRCATRCATAKAPAATSSAR